MKFIVINIILLFFLIIICFIYIILIKKESFCINFPYLDKLYKNSNFKLQYLKLKKSNCNNNIKNIFSKITKPIFIEKTLIKNKNFLLATSKFVDFKINRCKSTFRAKNDYIFIDSIAELSCSSLLTNNKCDIYKNYAKYKNCFLVRQKEDKIFKFLLAQKLINILCNTEKEINSISKIIIKSKTAKKLKNCKKQLLFSAQIYSIKKFNSNSTKILNTVTFNINSMINKFFVELFESEKKIKIIITYLTVMFS